MDATPLRQAAADAAAQLAILKVQQEALGQKYRSQVASTGEAAANLSVVQVAAVTEDDMLARLQQFGLAGAFLGAVLALLLAVVLERRRTARLAHRAQGPVRGAGTRTPDAAGTDERSLERSLNGSVAVTGERVD